MTTIPRLSIVTAVFNRKATIQSAIDSVANQDLDDFEYVIIDGMSNDGTEDIISANSEKISTVIREPDDGIYDALNKGIRAATGDVIGFLHADDLLGSPDALRKIRDKFNELDCDAVYGDLHYVSFENTNKIIRYWKAGPFARWKFRFGWMPPHPTVYIRKSVYEEFGMYRTDLGSAADYECMVRLIYRHQISMGYNPSTVVKMRMGGKSNESIRNRLEANQNDRRAWLENDLRPPFGLRLTKPLSKVPQYFTRPQ